MRPRPCGRVLSVARARNEHAERKTHQGSRAERVPGIIVDIVVRRPGRPAYVMAGRAGGTAGLIADMRRTIRDRALRHHQGDPSLGPDLLDLRTVDLRHALDEVLDPVEELAELLVQFAVWSLLRAGGSIALERGAHTHLLLVGEPARHSSSGSRGNSVGRRRGG